MTLVLTPLLTVLGPFAVLLLAGVVFAETGLLVGFFLPGDSLLFAAGLFAGTTGGVGGGLGVGFGVGFGLNVLGSALFATLFPLGVAGLSFIGSRAIYRVIVKKRRHAMGGLFEQLFHEVKACLADLALPPGADPID